VIILLDLRSSGPVKYVASKREQPGIFERLESRGIGGAQYVQIKRILTLDLPQTTLFFQNQFGSNTPSRVLRLVNKWRQCLRSDFIVPEEQRKDLEKSIAGAEIFAWNAIIEASFPELGSWKLTRMLVPTTSEEGRARYIQPDIKITAVHEGTGETRVAAVSGTKAPGPEWCESWRKAFEKLGLLELVLTQDAQRRLVSPKGPQAWPIYTQVAIPRLYEFLLPFYPSKGHITAKEETFTRDAYYPRDLLEDMLAILRAEQPQFFERTKLHQLKAVVQRYRARRNTQSIKTAENRKTSTSF